MPLGMVMFTPCNNTKKEGCVALASNFDNFYNTVYSASFGSDVRAFDPTTEYYTVLYNYADPERSEFIFRTVNSFMAPSSYRTVLPDEDISVSRGLSMSVNHVLLFDEDDSTDKIRGAINMLYSDDKRFFPGDRLVTVMILPKCADTRTEHMRKLFDFSLPNDTLLYFLTDDEELPNNVYGTLLLHKCKNLSDALYNKHIPAANERCKTVLEGYPTVTQELVKKQGNILWSTVHLTYHDYRMEFIREYYSKRFGLIKSFDTQEVKKILGEMYSKLMGQYSVVDLTEAIEMTPRICTQKITDAASLDSYFSQCFGDPKIPEFTLKINLSVNAEDTRNLVSVLAKQMFDFAKKYHSNDIVADILSAIDNSLEDLKIAADDKYRYFKAVLNDTYSEKNLSDYINRYIEYDHSLNLIELVRDLKDYITINRALFEEQIECSRNLQKQYDHFKNRLLLAGVAQLEDSEKISAEAFFSDHERPEFREKLRNECVKVTTATVVDQGALDQFFNSMAIPLSVDQRYDVTVNTIPGIINQRIGRYIMFQPAFQF